MKKHPYAQAHFLVPPSSDDTRYKLWADLDPLQRALLATDGSFTLLLSALSGEAIIADVTMQEPSPSTGTPPLLRRSVILRTATTKRTLVYATSTIHLSNLPNAVGEQLQYTADPIGLVLREHELETFRQLDDWGLHTSPEMVAYFGIPTVLFRSYTIYTNGKVGLEITEYLPQNVRPLSTSAHKNKENDE